MSTNMSSMRNVTKIICFSTISSVSRLTWQSVEHEHDEDLDFNDLGKKSMFTKMNNGPKKYATIDF